MWTWQITQAQAGQSIHDFLKNEAAFSKRLIIKAKSETGLIAVNGEKKTVRYILAIDDNLTVQFPEEVPSESMYRTKMPLNIIYEDKDLLILNKPGMMAVIPSREHPSHTLANGVLAYFAEEGIASTIHVVTRLDSGTSGIVLLAKNQYTHSLLSNQQRNHQLERHYTAIVTGELKSKSGRIDQPIGRKSDSIIERTVTDSGKRAVTRFQVVKTDGKYSLVRVQLETGRTHQIRVHFSHLGYPLLGDTLYGTASDVLNRQALHCHQIRFKHPFNNQLLTFDCGLPDELQEIVDKMI